MGDEGRGNGATAPLPVASQHHDPLAAAATPSTGCSPCTALLQGSCLLLGLATFQNFPQECNWKEGTGSF